MNSICIGQEEEDKFAHPDGEDAYGPRYELRQVPSELREMLDEQGRYAIPSFIDLTIRRDEQDCWVIDQVPAAGTIITCPQTVNVQLEYTCGGAETHWARLPIELIDITPPDIDIALDSNSTPHTSFGGVQRYLIPAAVVPFIATIDSCDANPARTLLHNGQPYQLGTPITAAGLHVLSVSATDSSENTADADIVFEIRQRPSRTGALLVESTQWVPDQSGHTALFSATVRVSATAFNHRDILLSSARMLLRSADGQWISTEPIPIKDALEPPCPRLQHDLVAAQINDCFTRLTFEALVESEVPMQPPAALDIVGVGMSQGQIAFEWGASAQNEPGPAPWTDPCTQPGRRTRSRRCRHANLLRHGWLHQGVRAL